MWRKKNFYSFKSKNRTFLISTPKIIRILSPDIKHCKNNSQYNQSLREFTVNTSDIRNYIHREFGNFELIDVLNDSVKSFEVTFVDENNKQLRLGQGLPSWTKLIFRPIMGNKENVRISSEPSKLYPNNILSEFNVELP